MIRRPPRSTQSRSSAASDVYKRQGGRMWLIRAWLNDEIKTSPHFAEILYSCVACDNCKNQCVFPKFRDFLPDIFQEAKAELVNEGRIPPCLLYTSDAADDLL